MVRIGGREIGTRILLAPLAGWSDLSFRLICREHGARFCFFEMIDANSLVHRRAKRLDILKTCAKDRPIAAQLLGSDPEMMLCAAEKLLGMIKPLFLDINCACPVNKVIKKKAGAYLLGDTKRMAAIIKALSSSLPIPVTAKIRIGFGDDDAKKMPDVARICEASGAAALFVHGRTREQGYAGSVNYSAIRDIKASVGIPVFGSGDILTPELAGKMFDETLCDGICVARGALGNPWIFGRIEAYLKDGRLIDPPVWPERRKVLKKHLSYIKRYKEIPPAGKLGFMRKTALWYLKGFQGAPRVREGIVKTKSYDELINLIDGLEF